MILITFSHSLKGFSCVYNGVKGRFETLCFSILQAFLLHFSCDAISPPYMLCYIVSHHRKRSFI